MNDRRDSNDYSASVCSSGSGSDLELRFDRSISTSFESDLERDVCLSSDLLHKRKLGKLSGTSHQASDRKSKRHELCGAHETDLPLCRGSANRFLLNNASIIEENADNVTQKLLSARKLKISELKSEVYELKIRVKELIQENRLLKDVKSRQEKELGKIEEQRSDLPNILRCHAEEVRVLKKQLKRAKERNKNNEYFLKRKEDELEKMKNQLDKLNRLAVDKKLPERNDLRLKLATSIKELNSKNKNIEELEKKIDLVTKTHRQEMKLKNKKFKAAQEQLDEMRGKIQDLEETVKAKNQRIESQNIYCNRKGGKVVQRKDSSSKIPVVRARSSSQRCESNAKNESKIVKSSNEEQESITSPMSMKSSISTPDLSENGKLKNEKYPKKHVEAWNTPEPLIKIKPPLVPLISTPTKIEMAQKQRSNMVRTEEENIIMRTGESELGKTYGDVMERDDSKVEIERSCESTKLEKSPTPMILPFVSPTCSDCTGYNTPSTVIELSPDNGFKDSTPTPSTPFTNLIQDMLNGEDTDEKLTLYFPIETDQDEDQLPKNDLPQDDENFHSDSSNSSNNAMKAKKKYRFSRPIENLHRGRPAHGASKQRKVSAKEQYSIEMYEPSFLSSQPRRVNSANVQLGRKSSTEKSKAERKAMLMTELFGTSIETNFKSNDTDEGLRNDSAISDVSYFEDGKISRDNGNLFCGIAKDSLRSSSDVSQNFGHSPFAFDEIAPRSRRSGKVSGLYDRPINTEMFKSMSTRRFI